MNYTITDLMTGAKTIAHSVFGKKKEYNLQFNHEADGCWYVDFPNWPFDHHNLMMVAGANMLCQYVAEKEGHPEYALVDVTTGDNLIDGKINE